MTLALDAPRRSRIPLLVVLGCALAGAFLAVILRRGRAARDQQSLETSPSDPAASLADRARRDKLLRTVAVPRFRPGTPIPEARGYELALRDHVAIADVFDAE